LEGPYLVAAWSALWRHGIGTSGTAATCVPLLKEWSLSLGIVATCLVIPSPVAAWRICHCSLTWRRGPRPRRREVRCDLILIVGIVAQGSCSVYCARTNRAYSASMGGIVVSSSFPCLLQTMAW
jgi:hypothetical protein